MYKVDAAIRYRPPVIRYEIPNFRLSAFYSARRTAPEEMVKRRKRSRIKSIQEVQKFLERDDVQALLKLSMPMALTVYMVSKEKQTARYRDRRFTPMVGGIAKLVDEIAWAIRYVLKTCAKTAHVTDIEFRRRAGPREALIMEFGRTAYGREPGEKWQHGTPDLS